MESAVEENYYNWPENSKIFSRTVNHINSPRNINNTKKWIPAHPIIPEPPKVPGIHLLLQDQNLPIIEQQPSVAVVQYQDILTRANDNKIEIIQSNNDMEESIINSYSYDLSSYVQSGSMMSSFDQSPYATKTVSKSNTKRPTPRTLIDIPGYKIIKILGVGSFGTVAHIRKIDDGQEYVVKMLSKRYVKRKIYENEVAMLQQIQPSCGDYLLCYIGHDETDDQYLIFLEHLDRFITLQDYLYNLRINNRGIIFTPEQENKLLTIVNQLLLGLNQLHSVGIAHRDIKPDNILIGPSNQIKFIDFGLACNSATCPTDTTTGTITYLAPEVLKRKLKPATLLDWQRADYWSLGLVIYHISNLISYSDEILAQLRLIPFMSDASYKHIVAYILGIISDGNFNWYKTLKWRHPFVISTLTSLLQVDPNQRMIPELQ